MPSKIFLKYGTVKSINMIGSTYNGINEITELEFICQNGSFKLLSFGECCSDSYLEINENDDKKIIGKTIKKIINNIPYIDNIKNNEYKKVTKINIIFSDNTAFSFNLINESNGYYNGWFEIEEQ